MLFELGLALEHSTTPLALQVLVSGVCKDVFLQLVLTVELFLAAKMFAERTFIPATVHS